mgnify:CR=1 FL=1
MKFGGQPTPWSEVEVEGLRLRSVSQILIQEIGAAGPENAEDSARRACGVIQRQADQIVSADTRIAELESALTVRDTEIARLETDLDLARREVVRLKNKCNATFDAIHEHTSRAATKRIFAAVKEFDPAARAGNGGEG